MVVFCPKNLYGQMTTEKWEIGIAPRFPIPLRTKILPPSLFSLKKSREATRAFFNIFGRGNVGLCNLELCVGEGGGVSASSARRRTFESPATEKEEKEKQQEQLGGLPPPPPPPRDRAKARKSLLLLLLVKVVHFGKGAKRQWGEPERSGRTDGRWDGRGC